MAMKSLLRWKENVKSSALFRRSYRKPFCTRHTRDLPGLSSYVDMRFGERYRASGRNAKCLDRVCKLLQENGVDPAVIDMVRQIPVE